MIVGIIQARMGSSRLPNKMLEDIEGKNAIQWCFDRMSQSKLLNKVIVATSDAKGDDVIEEYCEKNGIPCFRGDEEDLLDRIYLAAKKFGADVVVRITGDCPCVDPELIDKQLVFYQEKGPFDYLGNNTPPTYAHGLDIEVINVAQLAKLWENEKDEGLRGLCAAGIYTRPEKYNVAFTKNDKDMSHLRITLDYAEDLALLRRVFAHFKGEMFHCKDIEEASIAHPEIFKLVGPQLGHKQSYDLDNYQKKKDAEEGDDE